VANAGRFRETCCTAGHAEGGNGDAEGNEHHAEGKY
jgi:hypothetical protein